MSEGTPARAIDKVLAAARGERRKLVFAPWGLDLYVGPILAGDMLAVDARKPETWVDRNILLLIQKAEGENGERLFSWGDFDHFQRADWEQLQDVFEFLHAGDVATPKAAEEALVADPT